VIKQYIIAVLEDRKCFIINIIRGLYVVTEQLATIARWADKGKRSLSRQGICRDNVVSESFFGSLKTERVFFANY